MQTIKGLLDDFAHGSTTAEQDILDRFAALLDAAKLGQELVCEDWCAAPKYHGEYCEKIKAAIDIENLNKPRDPITSGAA